MEWLNLNTEENKEAREQGREFRLKARKCLEYIVTSTVKGGGKKMRAKSSTAQIPPILLVLIKKEHSLQAQ
jgi:hypothetical protein